MTRVLIVDDKPENLYLLRALLQGHGYEVEEARHGAEAIARARLTPPGLIISDLLMPVMDGYTLLRHWKLDERLKKTPFIVYTATYTEPKDEKLALDLGADAFILKPAAPDLFMARLQEVLAKYERGEVGEPQQPMGDEKVQLKEYNETLIRKLETKMFELEQCNRALEEDITTRKRAEEELLQSEAKFRMLAEESLAGVVIIQDGRFKYVNAALAGIMGYSKEELLALASVLDLVAEKDRPLVRENLRRRLAGEARGLQFAFCVRTKTGSIAHLEVFGSRMIFEDRPAVMSTVLDTTERKRAEEALQNNEQYVRDILDNLAAFVGLFTPDGIVLEVNRPPLEAAGQRREEVIGKEFAETYSWNYAPAVQAQIREVIRRAAAGEIVSGDFRSRMANDVLIDVFAVFAPLRDASGTVVRVVGSGFDITARKRVEQELEESRAQLRALLARLQRAQEEERILVSREIHDELGQLLTGLKMDVRWLERKLSEPGLPPALNPLLDRAVAASELADAMIATVQKIAAQLRPGVFDELGLEAALAQEGRRFQERSGVHCTLAVAELWPVLPPEIANELFHICQEALTNVARHARAASVEIRLTTEGDAVVLEVRDDGVGMAEAVLKAPRSLGLVGMRERAVQCGGTIAFRRNEPRGTRVTVRVPMRGDG